ncbi:hypothetical protein, partial [Bordetella pertussis]|uniref:hypothetical protein n=1 Tax=Bordetella pertussis TaxID=520 RepID=UPI0036731764
MPHSVACLDLRVIALLEAKRAGLLRRAHWLPNIVSGLIVGVVALGGGRGGVTARSGEKKQKKQT